MCASLQVDTISSNLSTPLVFLVWNVTDKKGTQLGKTATAGGSTLPVKVDAFVFQIRTSLPPGFFFLNKHLKT